MSGPDLAAKRALLGLLGGREPGGRVDWPALAAMAAAHRLEPLLAWRHERAGWPVPEAIAARWRAARRDAALAALTQQAALRAAIAALAGEGIACVALKGVRLAWRHYPAPALRPMRDLDLLVPAAEVLRAAQALAAAGFAPSTDDPAAVAEALARDKHLPPLWHAGMRVAVELHHRLSDPPARHAYRAPQLDAAAMLARAEPLAIGGVGVACPAPADLLAHLMVHALYGHRLDCGPLVLADIHFLAAGAAIDWAALRAGAEQGGWARGAELLLALTARHFGPPTAAAAAPPDRVLAAAEEALLADPATRDHAETLADLTAARSLPALGAALRRRLRPDRQVVAAEGGGRSGRGFWPVWAARRVARLAARLLSRRAMREARGAARVLRWLQADAANSAAVHPPVR